MLVMISNASGAVVGYLAGRFPAALGHLYSPGGQRGPWPFLPYALDNGAWPAHKNGRAWNEGEWLALLRWAAAQTQPPLWAIVPDVVGDRMATIANWNRYFPTVRNLGFPSAFAAQDGMTFGDVPTEAETIFLGGSSAWKLAAIGPWCAAFPGRVHVGRVNTRDRLWHCYRAGAVSVDGTGWFRDSNRRSGGRRDGERSQRSDLIEFLRQTAPGSSPP